MTGQSSARPEKSAKNNISTVANVGRSNMFALEEMLATKYEILKENHEILVEDYKSLEESYKIVNDMNNMMKLHLPNNHNRPMEHDAKNLRLLKDLESERSEKEEYKKMIERMKRMESEKVAMISELKTKNRELLITKEKEEEEYKKMKMKMMASEKDAMIKVLRSKNQELLIAKAKEEEYKKMMVEEMKRMESEKDAMIKELRSRNQELLIAKEKEEEEYKKMLAEDMNRMGSEKDAMINELMSKNQELLMAKEKVAEECKKIENKYAELTERFRATESECSFLKSLYDAENAIGQGGNDLFITDEVSVLDDHNVPFKNTVSDAIVISDESDCESDDSPPRKSNIIPQRSVCIKEEQCSNGANSAKVNLRWWSSSSSSSDDEILIQRLVKRSRDV